jgi:hypothetical protein
MQNEAIDMQIRREINYHSQNLTKSLLTGEPNKSPDESYDDLALGYIAVKDFPEMRILERLSIYERRFELSLYRTMAELKKLQKDRKAEQEKPIRLKKQFIPKGSQIRQDLSTPLRFAQDDKEREYLEKQSQSPAFGRKSEARNPKPVLSAVEWIRNLS